MNQNLGSYFSHPPLLASDIAALPQVCAEQLGYVRVAEQFWLPQQLPDQLCPGSGYVAATCRALPSSSDAEADHARSMDQTQAPFGRLPEEAQDGRHDEHRAHL